MTGGAKKLDGMTVDGISKLKINELRGLCRAEGLPAGGKKAELIKRLITARRGIADRFVGAGMLKCKVCSQPAKVVSTKKKTLDNGRTLVVRQVKCTGRHGHTYPLKSIIDG